MRLHCSLRQCSYACQCDAKRNISKLYKDKLKAQSTLRLQKFFEIRYQVIEQKEQLIQWNYDVTVDWVAIGHVRYVWPRRERTGSNTPSRGWLVTGWNFAFLHNSISPQVHPFVCSNTEFPSGTNTFAIPQLSSR